MKKIDIGQALTNPDVAKTLSEFSVAMMSNSDVTKNLREAFVQAQDKDLETSSKKLIEAIESYREKTIVDPSPKIIPRTPKYKKNDIVLYEDNKKNVFTVVINHVEPLSADYHDEPAYTITNILDPKEERQTVESKLTSVAELNNLIVKYKSNIKSNNDHNGTIATMLDSALKKLKILVRAIKIYMMKTYIDQYRPLFDASQIKINVNTEYKMKQVLFHVMEAARVNKLVKMIENSTDQEKLLVADTNSLANKLLKDMYDLLGTSDKIKYYNDVQRVQDEAKAATTVEAAKLELAKLVAMAEAEETIMMEGETVNKYKDRKNYERKERDEWANFNHKVNHNGGRNRRTKKAHYYSKKRRTRHYRSKRVRSK
jgi:hypothetical protein